MKILTVTHEDVNSLLNKLTIAYSGIAGEDLVFVIRPKVKMTDSAKLLLKHKGVEVVRDNAAPIDSAYLLLRREYLKLSGKANTNE